MARRTNPTTRRVYTNAEPEKRMAPKSVDPTVEGAPNLVPAAKKPAKPKLKRSY